MFILHCGFALSAFFALVATASAQTIATGQLPLWSARPDVATFEKNDRLAAAQHSIDQIVAVNGARTIENTLAPYDDSHAAT